MPEDPNYDIESTGEAEQPSPEFQNPLVNQKQEGPKERKPPPPHQPPVHLAKDMFAKPLVETNPPTVEETAKRSGAERHVEKVIGEKEFEEMQRKSVQLQIFLHVVNGAAAAGTFDMQALQQGKNEEVNRRCTHLIGVSKFLFNAAQKNGLV